MCVADEDPADAADGDHVQWCGGRHRLVVASSSEDAEQAAAGLLRGARAGHVVGLDTEWSASREVALLQLSGDSCSLLCPLPEVELQRCPSLLALLADPALVKAGVGIAQDAAMLQDAGVPVAGCCDLFLLAAREGHVPSSQPCGLAHLTELLLGTPLPKDDSVRKSDWAARPLSREQLHYAARDALAGRDCAKELVGRAHPEVPVVDWCGELLDRAPGRLAKRSAQDGRPPSAPAGASSKALTCKAYACVTMFGTRRVIDSEGRTMLHMRDRTVDALIRRGLASVSEGEGAGEAGEQVVRLNFSPSDNYDYAGLDAAERNACVGCGESRVARYYVVPKLFFLHLPKQCKSYNCHDIVMLCPACRAKAEPPQLARVQELLRDHGAANKAGLYANENALSAEQAAAKGAASALLRRPCGGRRGALPAHKEAAFRQSIAAALGLAGPSAVTDEHLQQALALGGEGPLPSERACAAANESAEELRAFLRDWRQLFLESLQPRFLNAGWAVDTGLDGRFVPSVASCIEWPDDWYCEACGVHCFGRSSRCRCCGGSRPIRGSEDGGVEEVADECAVQG